MRLLNKRTWLTGDDASFIFTQVEQGSFGLDTTLKISGGTEVATFWLNIDSKKERKDTIKMLDKLSAELNNMAMVIEDIDA